MMVRKSVLVALCLFAASNAQAGQSSPGTAPAITSGRILTPKVNVAKAPAAPAISVQFTTGPAGLSYISAQFNSSTSAQRLTLNYFTAYKSPPVTHGTLRLQRVGNAFGQGAFNLYSAAGTWTLTSLSISDQSGGSTSYNQTQLAAIFPSLTVQLINNGSPDITVPLVTAGQILTPTVHRNSAHPDFGASLTVSDDVSGVQYGLITVHPPTGTNSYVANQGGPAPVLNGKIRVYVNLGGLPTGTWTITQFGLCDVAGNCHYDLTPSDIQTLFGTDTFQVVN